MVPSPSGVTLTPAEKKKWIILEKLPYQVARRPCPFTLRQLGIEQCFQELCEVGQLSGLLFAQGHPSYQLLTLEFLSTLTVNKTRQAIVSITFQMKNARYDMPIEQFNEIFGFTGVVTKMPYEFSHSTDKFWQDITTERKFSANRAKSSSIRNPILRILQKACVCYPFARIEHGSITRDELFLLWQILYKQPPLNLGHFMIKHLERATKKKKGTLCVGAVVSAIALHLGMQVEGLVADIGEHGTLPTPLLDITFLKRTSVIASDGRGNIYLKQKAGDHFPLPDPDNTYVNGPEQRANWLMNSSAHRHITSRNPGNVNVSPNSSDEEGEDGDEEEEEENEEAPTQQGGDRAGTSTSRRRNRGDRLDEDINAINNRLDSVELNMQQLRENNDAQWAQWHQQNSDQWASINAQFGNFYAQYDERWATFVQQQQDFMASWRPPHHPPNQ